MSSLATGPILRIATLETAQPQRRRLLTAPMSIALHLAALAALVLVPVMSSSELPQPSTGLRAFLVEPPQVAAPPPPPPPAPAVSAAQPTPAPPTDASFVAPVSVPDTIVPEAGLDLGLEGGVPGGVEGGVPGGVV
jgi:protein TonB